MTFLVYIVFLKFWFQSLKSLTESYKRSLEFGLGHICTFWSWSLYQESIPNGLEIIGNQNQTLKV